MSLAVVRNLSSARALRTAQDVEDLAQEIVDQCAMAMAAAGLSDGDVNSTRSVITDLKPQALREDRILQEIHATGGDIRRICDLFGITVQTALRYANTLGHPDLTDPAAASSRTQDPTEAIHVQPPPSSRPKPRQKS